MNAHCGGSIVTQDPTLRKARFQFKAALIVSKFLIIFEQGLSFPSCAGPVDTV